VHPASVAVRHISRDTTHGTHRARKLEEVSVPARRALSRECWCLPRLNLRAARLILANKRRVEWWLLVSLGWCSRHNQLGAVGVLPSRARGVRQSRLHPSPQRGDGTLPSIIRSLKRRCPTAQTDTHSLATVRQTVWPLVPHRLGANSLTSS